MAVGMVMAATGAGTDRIGDTAITDRTGIAAIRATGAATDATTGTIDLTTITVHIITARITATEPIAGM
jgi:hypothetical protein